MNPTIIYGLTCVAMFILALFLELKFGIIRDSGTNSTRPYSYSRLQLLWWTFIVLSAFVSILISSGELPTLHSSTLILLGIGSVTTASARLIDISDLKRAAIQDPENNNPLNIHEPTRSFWLDILSDKDGVSIHRFQAVIFNLVFGVWFLCQVGIGMKKAIAGSPEINNIIPVITDNNLILLGLSAGTYAALKAKENGYLTLKKNAQSYSSNQETTYEN